MTSTLTSQQRDEFDRRGVLRLERLLSAERVGRARDVVLAQLERLDLWKAGAWNLSALPRPQWPATGLKTSKTVGNKRPEIEALIEEPALLAIVDQLLEGHAFDRTISKRPQVLFTLPNIDRWTLPTGWHTDSIRLASGQSPGVQLFTFLDWVEAGGGGTLVVAGSHRLLNEGRFIKAREMQNRLNREAFFRRLFAGQRPTPDDDPARLPTGAVGGVPLEVMELTGAPGDAWLIDLRVFHSGAPNASSRPRMMATHRFWRADLMAETAEGYGWKAPTDQSDG